MVDSFSQVSTRGLVIHTYVFHGASVVSSGSGTLRLHRMQHESISVQRELSSCLTTSASAEAQMVTKPPSATQSSLSMTICLHTQKQALGMRADCTSGESGRAADAFVYRHFRVVLRPQRVRM